MAVRLLQALLAVAVAAALGNGHAAAAAPPADFEFTFSTSRPASPADVDLHIFYRDPAAPDDPNAKPPALTEVEIAAPAGSVFDGGAVPACKATNLELQLVGPGACPAETVVGQGFGSVLLNPGPSEPFMLDAQLINWGDGILELFTFPGTEVTANVDRGTFKGKNALVLHPAVIPGITEREFNWTYLGTLGSARRSLITTPATCPRGGVWRSQLTYTVTTGATYSATSTTPCVRPRIRASVAPRRIQAGERARLNVRLHSADTRCIDGAVVRLGNAKARTNRAGRAAISAHFRQPGRRTLIATKRGCAASRADVLVRDRRAGLSVR